MLDLFLISYLLINYKMSLFPMAVNSVSLQSNLRPNIFLSQANTKSLKQLKTKEPPTEPLSVNTSDNVLVSRLISIHSVQEKQKKQDLSFDSFNTFVQQALEKNLLTGYATGSNYTWNLTAVMYLYNTLSTDAKTTFDSLID